MEEVGCQDGGSPQSSCRHQSTVNSLQDGRKLNDVNMLFGSWYLVGSWEQLPRIEDSKAVTNNHLMSVKL